MKWDNMMDKALNHDREKLGLEQGLCYKSRHNPCQIYMTATPKTD